MFEVLINNLKPSKMTTTSVVKSANTTKTKSSNESGHAKNVANFQDLITFVTATEQVTTRARTH